MGHHGSGFITNTQKIFMDGCEVVWKQKVYIGEKGHVFPGM